jgi:hypothetical protein
VQEIIKAREHPKNNKHDFIFWGWQNAPSAAAPSPPKLNTNAIPQPAEMWITFTIAVLKRKLIVRKTIYGKNF